ncbi:MAG: riboflavin biosynthesis protein RibD [SAR202 cluster bacterium Io17-Chloro-G9]|nr:MAG: riboflavin biosynthesis protein RibD [SAR202 cluster bacterium Io17-Chloro-G9]
MTPMARAIKLARQALGSTSPNPAVGSVVVKDGVVLGEGFTLPPGGNHAEIGALLQAGESSQGADLYTTLEPCCTFGRTPPCTHSIIQAGIKRVYLAVKDPNPQVLGKGSRELETAGIQVQVSQGEDAETARELYEAFAKHITTGLPFVIAKFAMSLDGKIATHTGDSKWVTGPGARALVQQLRRGSDAIMVGINTVLADDPQLTARDSSGTPLSRQPLRVVLDSAARTPATARLLQEPGKTVIAVSSRAPSGRVSKLEASGAEVVHTPPGADGRVAIGPLLEELGRRDVVSLVVEGGGGVLGALFDGGQVDKVLAFVAPMIIGGSGAASPVAGTGVSRMAEAWRLEGTKLEQVGGDWLVTGYPKARG